jgi:hypothetical protein
LWKMGTTRWSVKKGRMNLFGEMKMTFRFTGSTLRLRIRLEIRNSQGSGSLSLERVKYLGSKSLLKSKNTENIQFNAWVTKEKYIS